MIKSIILGVSLGAGCFVSGMVTQGAIGNSKPLSVVSRPVSPIYQPPMGTYFQAHLQINCNKANVAFAQEIVRTCNARKKSDAVKP